MSPRRTLTALAAAAGLTLTLAGCSSELTDQLPIPGQQTPEPPAPDEREIIAQAQGQLDQIPVKGRAPKTGYDRDEFGQRWADIDRNGCDQRNDVLARDLTEIAYDSPASCRVVSGVLDDPYSGETIDFTRGEDTSSDVQIDHTVALSNAWQTGAQQLSADQREQLANDLDNLAAMDGPTNQAKGDGDAATWLPPDRSSWCGYVASQTLIKNRYELWMTPPEHERISEILDDC